MPSFNFFYAWKDENRRFEPTLRSEGRDCTQALPSRKEENKRHNMPRS